MGPKKLVTFADAKKILGSVYPDLAVRINPNLNKLRTNLLKENLNGRDPKQMVRSVLKPLDDDMGLTEKARHPITRALDLLPSRRVHKISNVLLFRTRNQLLDISDFKKLAPKEESIFELAEDYKFEVRHGRAKDTLQERFGYYLIFKSIEEAAAFNVDTLGKQLNGVNFHLEMVNPGKDSRYLNSPLLLETSEVENSVLKLKTGYPRENCVLIKGLPTFITKESLEKMMYDYQIDHRAGGITPIEIDNYAKLGSWLIKFEKPIDAQRFVRNHNGFHFNQNPEMPKIFATVLS